MCAPTCVRTDSLCGECLLLVVANKITADTEGILHESQEACPVAPKQLMKSPSSEL